MSSNEIDELRKRLKNIINQDSEINLDIVNEKAQSVDLINQMSEINISKEIIEKIDISTIGQEIAIMLDIADEIQDACEELSDMELMSKLWNAMSGKTTNTLMTAQSFQIEMSKMIMKLSALNTLFAKEINNQTENLLKQQEVINNQNDKIIQQQVILENQDKKLLESQEKIMALIIQKKLQDEELSNLAKRVDEELVKLTKRVEENEKLENTKYKIIKEYDKKYDTLQEKYYALKRNIKLAGIILAVINLIIFGMVIIR